MNESDRDSVVAALVAKLRQEGSWSGETHVQKSTYLLDRLFNAQLGFRFIMYKFGPYSFELKERLTELRADAMLDLAANPAPYGPSFVVTSVGRRLTGSHREVVTSLEQPLSFVAKRLGSKTVSELERVATAVFMKKDLGLNNDSAIARMVEIKPHVSRKEAEQALREVDQLAMEAKQIDMASPSHSTS